jgi:hypothetical protein
MNSLIVTIYQELLVKFYMAEQQYFGSDRAIINPSDLVIMPIYKSLDAAMG